MIGWAIEALLASTLLMLLVLAIRRPVAQLFGARVAYALWLLPALRLILPPLPEQSVSHAFRPLPVMVQHIGATVPMPQMLARQEGGLDWMTALGIFWMVGALLSLVMFAYAYRCLCRRIRRGGTIVGQRDGIPIIVSAAADGPLALGVLRPAIVLPSDHAIRYTPAELALALDHEAAHHAGRDLAINMIALGVRALHWFNPIAIVAHRAFRADQEMACDARVLAARSPAERCDYLNALMKTALAGPGAPACGLGSEQLKRRIRMIARKPKSIWRILSGGALVAVVTGVGLGLTASGSVAAEQVRAVQHKVGRVIDHGPLARFVPPPPAVPGVAAVSPLAPRSPLAAVTTPAVPSPPATAEAPEPPQAPEAPQPPEVPDTAEIDATVQAALAEARASIAQARAEVSRCRSVSRGGCGEVDMREVRRDVIDGLREARRDLDYDDIPADARARVIASLDATIVRMERELR